MKPVIYTKNAELPKKTKIIDGFNSALVELFFIKNPRFKKEQKEATAPLKKFLSQNKIKPIWIFYHHQKTAVKTVPENIFFELRTARNKNIITKKEQLAFRNLRVGVAGLSVGSSIVSAMVLSGGPKHIKIADFDTIELTNLNRIQASLLDINRNKCLVAAERAWALDPFADLELYSEGLNEKNLTKFLTRPKLDVFVDAMDNIRLKILARQICKKNKIPVLMATDNGEGVILDVERYDKDTKLKIFNGRLNKTAIDNLKPLSFSQWLNLANKIVGINLLSGKMKESLALIGKNLAAVPQLGTSSNLAGSIISLCVRKIATKQTLNSGRYIYDLDKIFYATRAQKRD